MNKAMLAKAETLINEICTEVENGNHLDSTRDAAKSLRAHIPTLRKAATRQALDGGNPDDAATAALRAKLGITLDPSASGAPTATTLDELLTNWDTRLANVVKNAAPHPIARQRAYDEELLRMMKELRTLQNSSAAIAAALPIRSVEAEMAAKSDGEKSTLDLIKEAQRSSRFGKGVALGFSH